MIDSLCQPWDEAAIARFIDVNNKRVADAVRIACRSSNPSVDFILTRLLSGESLMDLAREMGLSYVSTANAIWRTVGIHVGELHTLATINWRKGAIRRVVKDKESLSTVAKDYGVSKQTISVWIREAGYSAAPVVKEREEIWESIAARLKSGHSKFSIMKDLGVSRSAIQTAAKKENIPLLDGKKGRKPISREHFEAVAEEVRSGARICDISDKYGIPYNRVLMWAREAGRPSKHKKKSK